MSRSHLPARPGRWRQAVTVLAVSTLPFTMAACAEDEPVEDAAVEAPAEDEPAEDEPAEDQPVENEPAEEKPADEEPVVLVVPFSDVAEDEGREVLVETAEVVDVPADEVFTIGTEESELLVYLTPEARAAGGSESAQNVEPGSTVTALEGTLEPVNEEFLSSAGVTGDAMEAAQEVGVYLAATAFELA